MRPKKAAMLLIFAFSAALLYPQHKRIAVFIDQEEVTEASESENVEREREFSGRRVTGGERAERQLPPFASGV